MAVRRGAAFASLALAVHLGASAAAGRERCDVAHFAAAGCAPAAGARACLECVGQHQLTLGARGCADADAQRYCGGAAAGPKTVFAHYMMCFHCFGNCTPGPSCSYQGASSYIEGYEAEMEIAQRFGLDGFALEWLGGDYYYNESYYNIFTACEVCCACVCVCVCVSVSVPAPVRECASRTLTSLAHSLDHAKLNGPGGAGVQCQTGRDRPDSE